MVDNQDWRNIGLEEFLLKRTIIFPSRGADLGIHEGSYGLDRMKRGAGKEKLEDDFYCLVDMNKVQSRVESREKPDSDLP